MQIHSGLRLGTVIKNSSQSKDDQTLIEQPQTMIDRNACQAMCQRRLRLRPGRSKTIAEEGVQAWLNDVNDYCLIAAADPTEESSPQVNGWSSQLSCRRSQWHCQVIKLQCGCGLYGLQRKTIELRSRQIP